LVVPFFDSSDFCSGAHAQPHLQESALAQQQQQDFFLEMGTEGPAGKGGPKTANTYPASASQTDGRCFLELASFFHRCRIMSHQASRNVTW
jgi:hypothetical protein